MLPFQAFMFSVLFPINIFFGLLNWMPGFGKVRELVPTDLLRGKEEMRQEPTIGRVQKKQAKRGWISSAINLVPGSSLATSVYHYAADSAWRTIEPPSFVNEQLEVKVADKEKEEEALKLRKRGEQQKAPQEKQKMVWEGGPASSRLAPGYLNLKHPVHEKKPEEAKEEGKFAEEKERRPKIVGMEFPHKKPEHYRIEITGEEEKETEVPIKPAKPLKRRGAKMEIEGKKEEGIPIEIRGIRKEKGLEGKGVKAEQGKEVEGGQRVEEKEIKAKEFKERGKRVEERAPTEEGKEVKEFGVEGVKKRNEKTRKGKVLHRGKEIEEKAKLELKEEKGKHEDRALREKEKPEEREIKEEKIKPEELKIKEEKAKPEARGLEKGKGIKEEKVGKRVEKEEERGMETKEAKRKRVEEKVEPKEGASLPSWYGATGIEQRGLHSMEAIQAAQRKLDRKHEELPKETQAKPVEQFKARAIEKEESKIAPKKKTKRNEKSSRG